MNKQEIMTAAQLQQATTQALGLMLQACAQQMNAQRLAQDLQARVQTARIVGIDPAAIQMLEQASAILMIETPSTSGKK